MLEIDLCPFIEGLWGTEQPYGAQLMFKHIKNKYCKDYWADHLDIRGRIPATNAFTGPMHQIQQLFQTEIDKLGEFPWRLQDVTYQPGQSYAYFTLINKTELEKLIK